MGKIEQLIGVNVPTGEILYRDVSINSGTRALFDMSNGWAGGKKNVTSGSEIKSLGYDDSLGTFVKSHEFLNGGMLWTGINGERFMLPEQFIPQVTDKHWLFITWQKIITAGSPGFNNQLLNIGGAGTSSTTALIRITPTLSSGVVTQIELKILGKTYPVISQLYQLYDGDMHQLAIEVIVSDDGLTQKVIAYMDAVSVYDSGFQTAPTRPTASNVRHIGTDSALPLSWSGAFYRCRFDDLSATSLSSASVITADYNSSRARFS